MTTSVAIRTNGNYVCEGKMTVTPKDQPVREEEIKVGPGSNVERQYTVPHGSQVSMDLTERNATQEEIEAAKPAA
ncbi:MAG: hypothetical protein AB7I42_29545 [Bradyrhizobium sp.]|uniref:hypothetical protein n=1 Tax=Bradyrhizobium sp. TaxID=376 RepID=UPI003D10BD7C